MAGLGISGAEPSGYIARVRQLIPNKLISSSSTLNAMRNDQTWKLWAAEMKGEEVDVADLKALSRHSDEQTS
jgi:hypothetical protein